MPVDLADAGGGSGTWLVNASLQTPHAGVNVSVDDSVSVPGRLAVTATVDHSAADGDVTGFVTLSRGTETRRIPFWVEVSHPVLGTEPAVDADARRHLQGDDRRRASRSSTATATRPTATRSTPAPRSSTAFTVTQPIANFGVTVLSGHVDPACRVRRRREPPRRLHRAARPNLNPYLEIVRRGAAGRGRDPADERNLRHRLRHAGGRAGRAVHVPLLGERHDPAAAAGPLDERRARSSSRSPTTAPGSIRSRCGRRSTATPSSGRSGTAG